jgi:hypothetical protein
VRTKEELRLRQFEKRATPEGRRYALDAAQKYRTTVRGRASHIYHHAKHREAAFAVMPVEARSSRMMKTSARASKIRGRPFTLTKQWIIERMERGVCELTGLPFDLSLGTGRSGRTSPFAPSIDRIDCSRGYEPGNCRMVLYAMNTALGDWGLKSFLPIARALIEQSGKATR